MKDIVKKFQGKRIAVIGDIMLDHYIKGSSTRLSPEAPVPILLAEKDSFIPGGAANVAINLASMGIEVTLCGIIGNDFSGNELYSNLNKNNIEYDPCFIKKDIPTIVKTRVVSNNHQICRIDREGNFDWYNLSSSEILNNIIKKLKGSDAIIISDYAKGAINATLLQTLVHLSHESNTLILMDPKPKNRIKVEKMDLLKPNKSEALELAGIAWEHHSQFPAEEVCHKIWQRFKPRYLVITLGAEGMLLSEGGKINKIIPTIAKQVFDVCGAGDTTMAALAAAMSAQIPIEEAISFANFCAGIVVGKYGTTSVSLEEIIHHSALMDKMLSHPIIV